MHETPVRRRDGFRERGHQVTRIEAFVDAACAFAVTLLVISVGSLPDGIPALIEALKGVPAFAGSFLLIVMFWYGHHAWSRRYGLDDGPSIALSLTLVFLILVYVYPLRMLFLSFFGWLSRLFLPDGWDLPVGFRVESYDDVRMVFMVYAAAWSTLGLVMSLLYQHAWRQRRRLELDVEERVTTAQHAVTWMVAPFTGLVSFTIAALLPPQPSSHFLAALPGMVYFLMILSWPLAIWTDRRVRATVSAEVAQASASAAGARANPFKRRRRRARGPRPSA
jgi:hypothetical protein